MFSVRSAEMGPGRMTTLLLPATRRTARCGCTSAATVYFPSHRYTTNAVMIHSDEESAVVAVQLLVLVASQLN